MQRNIIQGTIQIPDKKLQVQLHRQLGEFVDFLQRPKDHSEIQKDKRQSVPIDQLPMVF